MKNDWIRGFDKSSSILLFSQDSQLVYVSMNRSLSLLTTE